MIKNRPKTIIWFDWLFWSSVIVSYIGGYRRTLDFLWLDIIVLVLATLLWYLIACRASNVFKWIYAVLAFVVIGIFGLAVIASSVELELLDNELLGMSVPEITIGAVVNILSLGAAICLFLKPTRIWFQSKGQAVAEDDNFPDVVK